MRYDICVRYTQKQFKAEYYKQYPNGTKAGLRNHYECYKLERYPKEDLVLYEEVFNPEKQLQLVAALTAIRNQKLTQK